MQSQGGQPAAGVQQPQRRILLFFEAIYPMARASLWGFVGFLMGAWIVSLVARSAFITDRTLLFGFILGMVGWILGGGAWEACIKPSFGGTVTWDEGTGIGKYFRFHTNHKVVGMQYLVASGLAFLVAGVAAMLMRGHLLNPGLSLFGTPQEYNETFSLHGTLMLFAVSVVALVGGFGNYFVPLMIGAEDMTFPRLNGLSWWFVMPGVVAIAFSPLVGGFQPGWSGYAPISAQDASGQMLFFLGVFSLGLSSLLGAINFIATIIYMRAPGVTWGRLPIFAWTILATSLLNLLWVPVIGVGIALGITDRVVTTNFYNALGQPLLWQDLFWIFGHPEVYIIMLPSWGIWLEVIPVMTRKTLFGYGWALAGIIGVVFLSSYVWTHHMFTTVSDFRLIPFMSTTELISIPTGFMYIAAVGTLWQGRIRLTTPLLLVLMSMFNFVIGGLSGTFLADVPINFQMHNTFFVVAHFHYTIVGGMIFAWFAALYYWFPKYSGRMYNETWGRIFAVWIWVAFNLTFFTMFLSCIDGRNLRIAIYMPYLTGLNQFTSISAFVLGAGFFFGTINLLYSWFRGQKAPANPFGGHTLEWQTSSPPPPENFEQEPQVKSDFYGYGPVEPEPDLFRTVEVSQPAGTQASQREGE